MVKKKKKTLKKPREKLKKGLDVIMDWIQKQDPKDLAELGIYVSLAIVSYDKLRPRAAQNALWGPIALKLATTAGGVGSPSQIAGIAGLGVLGLAAGAGPEGGYEAPVGPQKELVITFGQPCPEGYSLMSSSFGFNYCVRTKKE